MPIQRSGAGNPARTLQLLWRDPAAVPRHGPRQGLSIDAVVDAATELADAESLEAMTMRWVAQVLGVVPLGLDDVTIDDCLAYLLSFVQAAARATADARDI